MSDVSWTGSGLEHSLTPPGRWYWDQDLFELERDRVFGRTWNFVAAVDELSQPGDYVTVDLAGEPIVVARDRDGRLRAFSNICRHRAGPVARGKGNARSFVCAYHGWCYDLDGTLRSARHMEAHPRFDPAQVRLPEYRVAVWDPFVFVSLSDDVPPLEECLGELPEFVSAWRPADLELISCKEWELDCNWKVFGENFCEGYHLPLVHPGFTDAIWMKEYKTRIYDGLISEQRAPEGHPRGPGARLAKAFGCTTAELRSVLPPLPTLDGIKTENYFFYYIFPSTALNLGPDGLSVIRLNPLSPERCAISYWSWFRPEESLKDVVEHAMIIVAGHQIQDEDKAIVDQIQPRLHSRAYECGPYSPEWERGVYHFADLVSIYLRAARAHEALAKARRRHLLTPGPAAMLTEPVSTRQ